MPSVLKIPRYEFFVAKRKKFQNTAVCAFVIVKLRSFRFLYLYTYHSTLSAQELFLRLMQSNFSYAEVRRSHSN
jgi:hypothetical protein